jgi:cardiolipin synthase
MSFPVDQILGIVYILYLVGVVIFIIAADREPTTTLAWLLAFIAFPILGPVLYFFVGRNWPAIEPKRRWLKEWIALALPAMNERYDRYAPHRERLYARFDGTPVERIIRSIEAENLAKPLPVTSFEIYPSGAEFFPKLLEELAKAQRFIHMQYFIWERDELTAKITKVLLDRLAAGVEVRIMYDLVGTLEFKKDEIHALEKAGAQASADIKSINKLNYRNHRKLTVIDGDIGFTGGMNLGQEYIDGKPKYPSWRDTCIRFTGPAVAELEKWFSSRWYSARGENLMIPKYLPTPDAAVPDDALMLQIVAHGVEDPWESARRTHCIAISGAEKRVWMQSPYFIPDPGTYDAMINAALGGVEVKFMMTGWPDHPYAFRAAETYWPKLIEAGGHVYLYKAGFFHAKTLTVDSRACAIGTMNMDIRSLRLHKEMMAWVYDEGITAQHDAIFERDLEQCEEVTAEYFEGFNAMHRFANSGYRMISNIM